MPQSSRTQGNRAMTRQQPQRAPREMPAELQDAIPNRLKRSLRYAGLSHHEMAEYMQCHRNTIGAWVQGKSRIKPALIRVWADRTGVPAEWIRTGKWPEGAK